MDWNYSGIGMVAERRDNQLLSMFKKEIEKIIVCAPRPFRIKETAAEEDTVPDIYFTNAAAVFKHLLQEHPEKSKELNDELRAIMPGHTRVFLKGNGDEKRLYFGNEIDGKEYVYRSGEKSEGEMQIFILYLLAIYYISEGYTVFIDEPDNYISLK